jgi:hypothetical protein
MLTEFIVNSSAFVIRRDAAMIGLVPPAELKPFGDHPIGCQFGGG